MNAFHGIVGAFSVYSLWKGISLLLTPGVNEYMCKDAVCRETGFVMSDYAVSWISQAVFAASFLGLKDKGSYRKALLALNAMLIPNIVFLCQSLSNNHLNEDAVYFPIVMLVGFMIASLLGASYFQRHSVKSAIKAPMFIHDAIELGIAVPNFLAALSLTSAPWNILQSLYIRFPCSSMVVLDKLVGASMLGIVAAKLSSIGSNNIHFRLAIVRAGAIVGFLSLIYSFILFGFRDVFLTEGQMGLFLLSLIQTGLRVFQLYNFQELLQGPQEVMREAQEQIITPTEQFVKGIAKGPATIPVQEPKKVK
jgi:hypothetical protein